MRTHFLLLTLATSLLSGIATAQQPAQKIEYTERQKVNAKITYEIRTTNFVATKWMVFLPEPPELPSQPKVKVTGDPAGKIVTEKSLLARKVRYIELSPAKPVAGSKITLSLDIETTLMTRKIVDLGENEKPPTIPPLTPAERKYYLSSTPRCDHDAKTFQKWLDAKSLRRERTESATDFAARILQVLRADYEYFYDPDQDKRASVACGLKATDCGGLTYLFVAAMRANDIPARVLVGRHAQPRKPGSTAAQTEYDRPHVRAEMFVANLGWVPVDPAYARESKRPVTAFIGTDSGDLLVLHIDTDLRLPYPDKERVADLLQINPSYWVNGRGTFDGQFAPSGWELKATAIEKK